MRLFFVSLCLLLATAIFSQEPFDSAHVKNITGTGTYQPVLTLTKTQIERLPAASFMELVDGAFSFVFGDPLLVKDFTFVIDGSVTIDPNVLNLSQIQLIQFYPAGIPATSGNLTRKGTFVITTLQGLKDGAGFVTKTGAMLGNKDDHQGEILKKHHTVFSLNELNYAKSMRKGRINSSLSHLRKSVPFYIGSGSFINEQKDIMNRFRFSNSAQYQLNKQWSLQGGLYLVHFKENRDFDNYYSTQMSEGSSNTNTNYLAAASSLSYQPSAKLQNTFSAEVNSYIEKASASQTVSILYGTEISKKWDRSNRKDRQNMYTFANQTSYDLVHSNIFSVKTELAIRYRHIKEHEEYSLITNDEQGTIAQNNSKYSWDRKNWQVTPGMYLDYADIFKVSLHLQYDDYLNKAKFVVPKDDQQFFPGLGLQMNLKNLFLKEACISDLSISSNYLEYWNDISAEGVFDAKRWTAPSYFNGFQSPSAPTVSKRWLSSLNLGLWRGRLAMKLNYLKEEVSTLIAFPSYDYNQGMPIIAYSYLYHQLKHTGKGIEVKANIIERAGTKWNVQGTLFNEKYRLKDYKNDSLPNFIQPIISVYDLAARSGVTDVLNNKKAHWTGGLRTEAEWNRMFLQGSVLFAFNDQNPPIWNRPEYFDNHGLNFLLIGYKFQLQSKKYLKGLEVSLQTRNLFKRKESNSEFLHYSYVGAGINCAF